LALDRGGRIAQDQREPAPASEAGAGPDVAPVPGAGAPGPAVPLRRNRDFLLLWTGQTVSAVGSSVAAIVYPLLALAATGSAALAGVVGFVGMAVSALLRLPSGVLADRYRLKPLMVGADLVRVATTASIVVAVLSGRVTLALLVAAAALDGAVGGVSDSAQAVAVRHVVPASQLPVALAQNEARGHLASLTGRPVGGYLYALGAALPVVADALSYLASAVLAGLVRQPLGARREPHDRGPIWRHIRVGLVHVRRSAFLRVTLLCAAGMNIVFAGLSLIIIAAQAARGTAAVDLGVTFSIGAVGGLLGAWASSRTGRWLSPPALVYSFGWIATLALLALGWAHNPYVIGALLGAVFFAAAPANAMLVAVQIDVTPPDLQGRVISAAMLTATVAAPLGPPLGGLLLDHTGQAATFAAFAALVAALTVVMHASPAIRAMRRPGER
jgi:MFS family permease